MNITNRIENILIAAAAAIIAIALTVAIMEMTSIAALKKENSRLITQADKQNAVIFELAKIEKYKIENRFDQVKAKDGQVVMSLDNKLSALSLDSIKPMTKPKVKKTFWQKLKFW
ncbi:MAG TPA: hypothetical protein PKH68_01405 [Paludibacteraceae bacterium]|nr:hypothetical protein [Paludibacteraceae bacterium]